MLTYNLKKRQGFEAVHNSEEWRVAVHTYDKSVNGLEAFTNWGIHENSEEVFVLLKGEAWLVTLEDGISLDSGFQVYPLKAEQMYVVEQGERHAIVLKVESLVLVMENRDMSQSYIEPVRKSVLETIKKIVNK